MTRVKPKIKKIKLDIKKVILTIRLMTLILMFSLSAGCGSGTGLTSLTDNTGGGGGNPNEGINLVTGKLGASGGFVDVDGDGVTDKIIGAPSAAKFSDLGLALVYKGGSTGFASVYTTLTGDNSFGSSFVNLGDADGDSKEDFAIGAIYGDGEDVSMCGAVHIYKGGSNGQTIIRKLAGEGPMDRFGLSMASGDLNGDGKKDIIIGAPFNTNAPSLYQSGAVYVYFGPDFTTKVALHASSTNKGLGWIVAAGDINNDGIADLLISASGKVLGYYGGSLFSPSLDSPDLTIASSATGFGKSLTVMGDVNSDGYKDMVIGAPNAVIDTRRDTGSIYII
ncbi:MAG: integrin alpha, partial [Nitrospirota bacterium]|nr:integrin alpha [Nitrospirota bacterium]